MITLYLGKSGSHSGIGWFQGVPLRQPSGFPGRLEEEQERTALELAELRELIRAQSEIVSRLNRRRFGVWAGGRRDADRPPSFFPTKMINSNILYFSLLARSHDVRPIKRLRCAC